MKERNFDINYDYKNYFPDFLLYGINLNKDEVDWWEFNKILDGYIFSLQNHSKTFVCKNQVIF